MSKYFITETDLFRITFEDGQWVDIKKQLSQRDQDQILNTMAKAKTKSETPDIEINLGKMALLEVSVKAWSFTEDDGRAIPVNPDNLSNLRIEYRAKVLSEIDRVNKEAQVFLPPSKTVFI